MNKADMESELNVASDEPKLELCKVHRVTTPVEWNTSNACACTAGRARHMQNIKGGKRKKLTCEAIFVYRRSPRVTGLRQRRRRRRQTDPRGRGDRTPRTPLPPARARSPDAPPSPTLATPGPDSYQPRTGFTVILTSVCTHFLCSDS